MSINSGFKAILFERLICMKTAKDSMQVSSEAESYDSEAGS